MVEFLKMEKSEFDEAGTHFVVSTRIEVDAETFSEIEKALKPLGITFRSPKR